MQDQYSILKSIINNSDSIIFTLDRNYCYTSFNDAHAHIMKTLYGSEIKIGRSLAEYQNVDEDWKRAKANLDRVLNGESIIVYSESGNEGISRQYFEIAHYPIKNDTNDIIGISVFAKNITEQRKLEMLKLENDEIKKLNDDLLKTKKETEEKEKFLRTITNVIPGMVGYWTADLHCNFANKEYYTWFGKMWEEMKGIHIKSLFGEELYNKNLPHIQKALNGKRADFERTLTKPSGEVGYTWAHYIPDIESGEVKGFFVLVSDITEVKKAQLELEKLNKELKESNITKDKFFSIIAHDLRSPFTGFLGLTKIMIENSPKMTINEIKEISQLLYDSANDLFKLLENLLDWSRMQNGTIEFTRTDCVLKFIVNQVVQLENEFARQKNIELITNIPSDIKIIADSSMLSTIFRNLISNAIKFTNPGGTVSISAEKKDSEIIVSVKDSGIGMSPSLVDKLFKIDEKVSRPGTNDEASTGLGLLLCKDFIQHHDGKIWVDSKEEEGSIFYISLPIIDENE